MIGCSESRCLGLAQTIFVRLLLLDNFGAKNPNASRNFIALNTFVLAVLGKGVVAVPRGHMLGLPDNIESAPLLHRTSLMRAKQVHRVEQ